MAGPTELEPALEGGRGAAPGAGTRVARALAGAARTLAGARRVEEVVSRAVALFGEQIPARAVLVHEVDEEDRLRLLAHEGLGEDALRAFAALAGGARTLAGRAAGTGHPQLSPGGSAALLADAAAFAAATGASWVLALPVKGVDGLSLGVVSCALEAAAEELEDRTELGSALAAILGPAWEQAIDHTAEQALRRRLEALRDVAFALERPADLRDVLQRIVDEARRVAGADHAALGVIAGGPEVPFDPWVFSGMTEEDARRIGRRPRPVGLLGALPAAGEPLRLDDAAADPRFRGVPPGHAPIRAFMGVPISVHGRAVGNLYLGNKRGGGTFSAGDEEALSALAQHAGIAIERVRDHDRVRRDLSELAIAREQLRRSEELLARTLEDAPIGMALVALDGSFLRVNRALCELTGYSSAELYRLHARELVHPDDLESSRALANRLLQGGLERFQVAKRCIRKDGRIVHVALRLSVVREPDGSPRHTIVQVEDETERLREEEARRRSEEGLAAAQALVHLGNWELDLQSGELRWSDECHRILGLTPGAEPPTQERCFARVHPEDRERVRRAVDDALAGAEPTTTEHRIVRPDGEVRVVQVQGQILRGPEGAPRLFRGTILDVTEREQGQRERERLLRELAAERRWLRTVIEHSPVGIILIEEPEGRVVLNRRAEEFLGGQLAPGLGPQQLVGRVCTPEGRALAEHELPGVRARKGEATTAREAVLRRPDGAETPVLISAAPIRDEEGRLLGAVEVYESIVALKELERLREEWTSVVAHDLRQPVTTIQVAASALVRQLPEGAQRTKAEHMLASARRLSRMVTDLLDLSRLESRRLVLDVRAVELPSLVAAVLERAAPVTAAHEVRLSVQAGLPQVEADPDRLEQILGNLLSNAAKYGYQGAPIDVRLARGEHEVSVEVSNLGQGIPAEEIPLLFARFKRVPGVQRRIVGLGLGLYITRGLVEAHGGRIDARSERRGTTTFRFTLPLHQR